MKQLLDEASFWMKQLLDEATFGLRNFRTKQLLKKGTFGLGNFPKFKGPKEILSVALLQPSLLSDIITPYLLARAPALSLTRSAQGKTSVSFAEQRRNEVATVFGDFPLLILRVPVYKIIL